MLKRMLLIFPLFLLLLVPVAKAGCIESIGYPGYEGIRTECSLPDGSCQQGDTIAGVLKINGTCPSTPNIQITIAGDGCSITDVFSAGCYVCTGPGCFYGYLWHIPQLPSGCLGKTVTVTITSEKVSASKTIKLSTDPTRDYRPSMPKWGSFSTDCPLPTEQVSYTVYAEDDKGLKEIRFTSDGELVKTCPVSGTSASCTYTFGPYSAGTEVCLRAVAIDTKGQEAPDWDPGARTKCVEVSAPAGETDGGKNYAVKGTCTPACPRFVDSDFCSWEGPRGYCCDILPSDGGYWSAINISEDGTTVCCKTTEKFGPCLETRTINCKHVLGEYYVEGKECKLGRASCRERV